VRADPGAAGLLHVSDVTNTLTAAAAAPTSAMATLSSARTTSSGNVSNVLGMVSNANAAVAGCK
jgi:hypothetical protein